MVQIISCTERQAMITRRAGLYRKRRLGVMFQAASQASGTAAARPSTVAK